MNASVEKAKKVVYEMLRDRKYSKIVEEDENIIIADDKVLVFFLKIKR